MTSRRIFGLRRPQLGTELIYSYIWDSKNSQVLVIIFLAFYVIH